MTNMLRFLFSPLLVLKQVSVDSEIASFSRYPTENLGKVNRSHQRH